MAFGQVGKLVKNVGQGIFNRTLARLTGAGISADNKIVRTRARWSGRGAKDWRVRLQIPNGAVDVYNALLANNELMEPLLSRLLT